MLELFPEGFEEVEHEEDLELAAYSNAAGEERFWHAFGPGTAADVEDDWETAWKRFHRPVRVGPLWIGPRWEPPDADAVPVVIDPGQAFGTGAHATTRLCLELLLERPRTSVIDLGCGSGVLAVAAAKLGFAPVSALDTDPTAVKAARENARANGTAVTVSRADVFVDPLPSAELALANLNLEGVMTVAERLRDGELVASGYLAGERPDPAGWEHLDRREAEGWAADLFRRLEVTI
ncbi:MAG TPA: 50S ribosomal protein L11 methyltransferase [Gaiellaceae bacterium]|jgi:ribosomal protein L11 methyltransferase|nr:50S ribosomal protein L11 methyltransferase [Gaiellaceae bacterium]